MAQNYIESGDRKDHLLGSGEVFTSGVPVVIGNLVGIPLSSGVEGDTVVVLFEGVFTLNKTTSLVITEGDALFWNTSTSKITKTVTHTPIGTAWGSELSAATTVKVKLYEDGNYGIVKVAANVAQEATANGSNAATTQALANALKVTVNATLTALKTAGLMTAD